MQPSRLMSSGFRSVPSWANHLLSSSTATQFNVKVIGPIPMTVSPCLTRVSEVGASAAPPWPEGAEGASPRAASPRSNFAVRMGRMTPDPRKGGLFKLPYRLLPIPATAAGFRGWTLSPLVIRRGGDNTRTGNSRSPRPGVGPSGAALEHELDGEEEQGQPEPPLPVEQAIRSDRHESEAHGQGGDQAGPVELRAQRVRTHREWQVAHAPRIHEPQEEQGQEHGGEPQSQDQLRLRERQPQNQERAV